MRVGKAKTLGILSAVALFSTVIVAFALTSFFTQTIPGQTFTQSSTTTSTFVMTEGTCGNDPVLDHSFGTIPDSAGQPATLVFTCSDSPTPDPAFVENTSGAAIPTFTLPSGWSLYVDSLSELTSGSLCTHGQYEAGPLTSGEDAGLLTGGALAGQFVYCLTSTSASTFTSFTINWQG